MSFEYLSGLSPKKNFSPQVVPDAVEVLLIEQNFTDGLIKGMVGQVRRDLFPARRSTGQLDGETSIELVTQVTLLVISALLTWSVRTRTWRKALDQAATSRWAASCQTCVHPQSSALCWASLWNGNADGHVWAAHPLRWSGNNLTSQSERLRPWAGLRVLPSRPFLNHHSSWASAWASLPSLWKPQ